MRKALVIRRGTAWQLAAAAGLSPLFVAAAAEAQTFQVSIGVRESGVVVPIGGNGGATGGIEWINLDGLTLVADGSWQQFTFNFGTDPVTAFAGATANGVLDGTRGALEHIRIRNISGVTDVLSMQIDDIVNTVGGTPTPISGFETTDTFPATVGTEHIFQEPRFSGSTQSFLANLPNATLVTDQVFHTGAQSNQADFQFNSTNPAGWLRLTTNNTINQPNPAIDFSAGNSLSFWLRMPGATLPEQRWINPGSGDWDDPNNWGGGNVPNSVGATANFLNDITSPATITLNNPITVTTIRLQDELGYTIVGGPSNNVLSLEGNAEDARTINAQLGSHTISAPVSVNLGIGTSASMVFNVSRAQDVLTLSGDVAINITNNATLTVQKTGPGRLDITNIETPDTITSPTNLLVSAGTLRFLPNSGRNHVNSLSIAGGATPTAQVDITNNPTVVNYAAPAAPLATIKAQIAAGYAGGSWNGNGIISSQANASQFGVGYAEASSLPSVPAIFGTVDADSILIRLTRYGDANLDGTVNLSDFNRLAANFGSTTGDWSQGDFNYDSNVNLSDFNRLAANFGLSAAGPTVTPEDWARLGAAVPEPGSVALLGAGALLGLRRRRRA